METSPTIDKEVINLFDATFNHKNLDDNKKQMFEKLKKPEICDTLESIELVVYKPDESEVRKTDYKQLVNDVVLNINQNLYLLRLGSTVSKVFRCQRVGCGFDTHIEHSSDRLLATH